MPQRPPVPHRWELHLAAGVLALLFAGAASRADSSPEPPAAFRSPELERWWEAGRAERSEPAWLGRFLIERNVVRGVTALLLAWRSYHLERAARR